MSELRKAAQQAIEAIGTIRKLINMHGEFWLVDSLKCHEAADALRRALAEPEVIADKRKPLTDAEISALDNLPSYPSDAEVMKFARRIERAHGIGINDEL